MKTRKHLPFDLLKVTACGVFLLASQSVIADTQLGKRIHKNPTPLTYQSPERFDKVEVTNRLPSEIRYDLTVQMIESSIFNPNTNRNDTVNLRGYRDTNTELVKGNSPFRYVAPTIQMQPGQTVRMMLRNRLPDDPTCIEHPTNINIPHCFNGTNMHTHGLWISPSGNSDNVLLKINPQVDFQYEYNVPPDHPAGTFWYHPHLHGSTALQVGSGMVGALIIRGDRQPIYENGNLINNGDLDLLLKDFDEQILVMQQVSYACLNDKYGKPKPDGDNIWHCAEGEVGVVENFKKQLSPGSWTASHRHTTINGEVIPRFTGAKVGELQRWRFIHAGVRDSISLRFRKMKKSARPFNSEEMSMADYVAQNCTGELLDYHLVASDGLTMSQALTSNNAVAQPGYRWDALLQFPEGGPWCLIDGDMPSVGSINDIVPSTKLLATLDVGSSDMPPTSLLDQLIASAQKNLTSEAVQAQVIKQLKDGLKLTAFLPHKSLLDEPDENFGQQALAFTISNDDGNTIFAISNTLSTKDAKPFDASVINRDLMLGAKDQWTLTSGRAAHPFHIHVNPFQIVKILKPIKDKEGKIIRYIDVSGPDAQDVNMEKRKTDDGEEKEFPVNDPQYPGMKGLWKDTIMVKQDYKVITRTHYQRYIGDFVLHCHILDHEDQGMMQQIRISIPDGLGGTAKAHH